MENLPQNHNESYEISIEEFQTIYDFLINHVDPASVLAKINPKLKTLYENRSSHYNLDTLSK